MSAITKQPSHIWFNVLVSSLRQGSVGILSGTGKETVRLRGISVLFLNKHTWKSFKAVLPKVCYLGQQHSPQTDLVNRVWREVCVLVRMWTGEV